MAAARAAQYRLDSPEVVTIRSVTDEAGAFTRDINVVVKRTPRAEQAKALVEVQVAP